MGFQQSVYRVEEGGEVQVCVVLLRSPELLSPVSIILSTIESTARQVDDFEPLQTIVQLMTIEVPACVSINIIDDIIMEENEEFFVSIIDSDNPDVQFQQRSATVIIQDREYGSML